MGICRDIYEYYDLEIKNRVLSTVTVCCNKVLDIWFLGDILLHQPTANIEKNEKVSVLKDGQPESSPMTVYFLQIILWLFSDLSLLIVQTNTTLNPFLRQFGDNLRVMMNIWP